MMQFFSEILNYEIMKRTFLALCDMAYHHHSLMVWLPWTIDSEYLIGMDQLS